MRFLSQIIWLATSLWALPTLYLSITIYLSSPLLSSVWLARIYSCKFLLISLMSWCFFNIWYWIVSSVSLGPSVISPPGFDLLLWLLFSLFSLSYSIYYSRRLRTSMRFWDSFNFFSSLNLLVSSMYNWYSSRLFWFISFSLRSWSSKRPLACSKVDLYRSSLVFLMKTGLLCFR